MSWVNWANQEMLMIMSKWYDVFLQPSSVSISLLTLDFVLMFHLRFLPLIPRLARPAPYDKAAVDAGKAATLALLDEHEAAIQDKDFLVGGNLTLADIFVAIYISRGLEWVLDAEWWRQHPATMKHFERVASWEHCKAIVPAFKQVDVEEPNADPYAS